MHTVIILFVKSSKTDKTKLVLVMQTQVSNNEERQKVASTKNKKTPKLHQERFKILINGKLQHVLD